DQKFSVTVDLEFAGAPEYVDAFGMAKLHAALDVVMKEGGASSAAFRELSGKGLIKDKGEKRTWSYDLQWKAGTDFRKTLLSGPPIKEVEQARDDLNQAFRTTWTVKPKALEASVEEKTESWSFLKKWASHLFLLPGPLPFAERKV